MIDGAQSITSVSISVRHIWIHESHMHDSLVDKKKVLQLQARVLRQLNHNVVKM